MSRTNILRNIKKIQIDNITTKTFAFDADTFVISLTWCQEDNRRNVDKTRGEVKWSIYEHLKDYNITGDTKYFKSEHILICNVPEIIGYGTTKKNTRTKKVGICEVELYLYTKDRIGQFNKEMINAEYITELNNMAEELSVVLSSKLESLNEELGLV